MPLCVRGDGSATPWRHLEAATPLSHYAHQRQRTEEYKDSRLLLVQVRLELCSRKVEVTTGKLSRMPARTLTKEIDCRSQGD